MARFIHMSDTHDETASKLHAVVQFAKEHSIDRIVHTGDLVEAKNVAAEIKQNLQHLPKPDQGLVAKLQNKTATEEEQKKYTHLATAYQQALLAPFAKRYQTIDDIIKKNKMKFDAVLGNHDSVIAYDVMKTARFAENGDIQIGDIVMKGVWNSHEFPTAYKSLEDFLSSYLTPYALGQDAGDNKELQKAHEEYVQQLKGGKKPDLILMHKELDDPDNGEKGIGTAAKKYLAENKGVPVLCGHFHDARIANYKDHPFIRPGSHMFCVIDMDEKTKKINWIDVYQFIEKGKVQKFKAYESERKVSMYTPDQDQYQERLAA